MTALKYLAVALFGSCSWLCVNAIWIELSLLTQYLPEKWTLPSYLEVTIQLACVLPLISSIVWRKSKLYYNNQFSIILALLVFCSLIQLALVFLWKNGVNIFGAKRSIALFLLTFCVALINATSNIVFMPYMATFHSSYLTAYFVGMGLSAFVPSIISLVQGTLMYDCVQNGTEKFPIFYPERFSVSIYMFIIFLWLCVSTLAFVLLCKFSTNNVPKTVENNALAVFKKQNKFTISYVARRRFWVMLICLMFVCAQLNSIIPVIQIYSALPYSLSTYHMSLTLANAAQSVACILPIWFKVKLLRNIVALTVLSTCVSGFIVVLAIQSPDPLLKNLFFGSALSVGATVLSYSINIYLRSLITSLMREDLVNEVVLGASNNLENCDFQLKAAEQRLFWCGAIMQLGSFVGSLIMFPFINVFQIFKMANFC